MRTVIKPPVNRKQMVHLHTHTELSLFDGCGKQEDFIEKAWRLGNPAIGLTEHGSMRGVYKQEENCRNVSKDQPHKIKPIYGIEFYLAPDMASRGITQEDRDKAVEGIKGLRARNEAAYQEEVKQGVRERFHLTAIAKDNVGLSNLFILSSKSWIYGFYKRPRIDLKTLAQHKEGIIILSGCLSGVINHYLLKGLDEKHSEEERAGYIQEAIENAEYMQSLFGDDFYIELMPHSLPEQVKCNQWLVYIADRMGIDIVATQDAHWINQEDCGAQQAMLCIHTKDTLTNPNRFKFDTDEFWLKTRQEMEDTFREHHGYLSKDTVKRALDNTLAIAEKCTAALDLDRLRAMIPDVGLPETFSDNESGFMRYLCEEGWTKRDIAGRAAAYSVRHKIPGAKALQMYKDRLEFEIAAIEAQKVVRYFLVIWDMYNFAHSVDIMCGPGRGSAGGCLVAFLLGITNIDPIEHGLLFERFLAPGRIDLPDIDCDFEAGRREEVIAHLRRKYGADNTAQIATVGTLKGKACLRDIGRMLEIPVKRIEDVLSSIVERSSGDERASQTIEDAFKEFEVCRKFHEDYPEVLELAKKLEGQARNLGVHAAGVVVSPRPIMEICPLETRQNGKGQTPIICTAVDMFGAGALGLMKIDVLGLRNLDSIKDALLKIKERHGVDIDFAKLDYNDKSVLANFTKHEYVGIFQYDTPSADKICEGVNFENFEDVVAMIALDRPGTARSGLATEYIKRKQDPKARKPVHPVVDKICEDTLGVIVYQEHVIKIFKEVAGFDPATADSLRKKIAKKWGDEAIGKERVNFINGAVAKGFPQALAEKLIDQITFFGSYGFNKSHATAYGTISYWQMYLRTYYPEEFFWSLLKHEPDTGEITRIVKNCRRIGVEVTAPHVNSPTPGEWAIEEDAIVGALMDIKSVGDGAVAGIAEARKDGPFLDLADFYQRINRRKVNRRVVEMLIKAGAMRGIIQNQKWTVSRLEALWDLLGKEKYDIVRAGMEATRDMADWTEDEAKEIASEVNPLSFGKHPLEIYTDFIYNVIQVIWLRMDDEALFDNQYGFIHGVMIEIKYNQIGDFHTGQDPTPEEKRRQKWGARYANINVEDMSGKQYRVKVDVDIFDRYRHIIDLGVGHPVVLHASLNKRWKSVRAQWLVDLKDMKKRYESGEPLSLYERLLIPSQNPLGSFMKKDIDEWARLSTGKQVRVSGLVTHVNRKLDKNMNEMAFFGIQGWKGYIEGVCFASSFPHFDKELKPGKIVMITLDKDKSGYVLNDRSCKIEVLE